MDLGSAANLLWERGDVPVSRQFGEGYYSPEDGLAEARHVFLAGTGLPDRFRPGFHIAELGFGTGLNVLAAWAAWEAAGQAGPLRVTSFEAHPLSAEDMTRAHRPFAELRAYSEALISAWTGGARTLNLPRLHLDVVTGDARATVPAWEGAADAWFLDGFSPARNPALWEAPLLAAVYTRTRPEGRCATFTAAGVVRRRLSEAGFEVERRDGFGRKRHMTVGRRT
ncbi:MAG: tRNA (5-methylaminomethyl-2-thiouridine)(34)-methyltransferase MnmD [Pseudomonadota bacterium]